MAVELATWGLLANLLGVVMLFYFGMPFRVPRRGAQYILLEATDHEGIKAERRYAFLGYVGLFLIVAGTALQIPSAQGWH